MYLVSVLFLFLDGFGGCGVAIVCDCGLGSWCVLSLIVLCGFVFGRWGF